MHCYKTIKVTLTAVATLALLLVSGGCDRDVSPTDHSPPTRSTAAANDDAADSQLSIINFNVTGMTCEHCVNSIEEHVAKMDSVRSIEVSLENELATVEITSAEHAEEVQAAIEFLGFTVSPTDSDDLNNAQTAG